MNKIKLLSLVLPFFLFSYAYAQEPPVEEMKRIEARGRQIADYERAATVATDLLLAGNPDEKALETYIAVLNDGMWTVLFGKITEKEFKYVYYYSCPEGKFEQMKTGGDFKFPGKDIYELANAVKLALASVTVEQKWPDYNPSVFREKDGTITVYFLPGNRYNDVVLIGGDYKVTVSADATKIVSMQALHKSVIKAPLQGVKNIQGGFHSHVLTDLPTETDVAVILLNPVLAPHYVMSKNWMTRIDADGKINFMGKSEEIVNKGRKR